VAASIASLIAVAGDRIIAAENALLMIHDPWTETLGNAATHGPTPSFHSHDELATEGGKYGADQ
jgi:hypothetical protein